jgi:hypothetical protein
MSNRRTTTALLLVGGVLGAALLWLIQLAAAAKTADRAPTVYALLHLANDEPIPLSDAPPGWAQSKPDVEQMKRREVAMIKSRPVLISALRDPSVADQPLVRQQADPAGWLEKTLQVDFPNNANLMRVGMTGSRREELAAIVNAVVAAYLNLTAKGERDRMLSRFNELEKVNLISAQAVRTKTDALNRVRATLKVKDPQVAAIEQQVLQQQRLDCSREIRRIGLEKAAHQNRLVRKKAARKDALEAEPNVARLEEEIALLTEQEKLLVEEEKRLRNQCYELCSESPGLKEQQQEIDVSRKALDQLAAEKERLAIELQCKRKRIFVLQDAADPKSP